MYKVRSLTLSLSELSLCGNASSYTRNSWHTNARSLDYPLRKNVYTKDMFLECLRLFLLHFERVCSVPPLDSRILVGVFFLFISP